MWLSGKVNEAEFFPPPEFLSQKPKGHSFFLLRGCEKVSLFFLGGGQKVGMGSSGKRRRRRRRKKKMEFLALVLTILLL